MFSKVLDKATSLIDARLTLGVFFPTLVFGVALGVLVAAVEGGGIGWLDTTWKDYDAVSQVALLIGAASLLVVVSYVVYANVTSLTRVLEGYSGPAAWLDELTDGALRKRRSGSTEQVRANYPSLGRSMPTKLGNVLRAAEVHPLRAYGIDAVLVWPRLASILPDATLKSVDAARTPMDFLVVVSWYGIVFTVTGAGYVAARGGGVVLYGVAVFGGLLVAWLAYFGAVRAASDYGDQIRSAFDLHRLELIGKLHLPLPASRPEEMRLWNEINEVVRASVPADWWVYSHGESSE